MSGNGPVCRADEEKWKWVCRWMWESGDWDMWKGVRASGRQIENGNEGAWGSGNVAGERDREAECDKRRHLQSKIM